MSNQGLSSKDILSNGIFEWFDVGGGGDVVETWTVELTAMVEEKECY